MAALSISHFDISTYLGNSLRAVRGDSDQTWDVILKFRPEMAGRVEENIWHHSQQLKG
ncbi:MAG: hypothetical protein R3C59_31265 [Planctomycetaceae bacterium]